MTPETPGSSVAVVSPPGDPGTTATPPSPPPSLEGDGGTTNARGDGTLPRDLVAITTLIAERTGCDRLWLMLGDDAERVA